TDVECRNDRATEPLATGEAGVAVTAVTDVSGGRPYFVWPSRQRVASVVLLAAALIAIEFYAPNFFRYHNIVNVLLQASLLGLLAIGMTVVMIVGGIDLSLPANMAMGAVLGAFSMRAGADW